MVTFGFGSGETGRLGVSSDDCVLDPREISGIPSNVTAAACGEMHSVVIADGKLYTFGSGGKGQLGTGNRESRSSPTRVDLPGGAIPVSVACGEEHTLVMCHDGAVFSFGASGDGQLGLGTDATRDTFHATPSPVTGFPGPAVGIAAGGSHSVVVTADGGAYAFGCGRDGQLGNNARSGADVPNRMELPDGAGAIVAAACGADFTLLLAADGAVYSTGSGLDGALGQGGVDDAAVPGKVKFPEDVNIKAIAAGTDYALAIDDGGLPYAWGSGDAGRLGLGPGDGSTVSTPRPVLTLPFEDSVILVACGGGQTLFATAAGRIAACGQGTLGQLGTGARKDVAGPPAEVRVPLPPGGTVTAIACGSEHTLICTGVPGEPGGTPGSSKKKKKKKKKKKSRATDQSFDSVGTSGAGGDDDNDDDDDEEENENENGNESGRKVDLSIDESDRKGKDKAGGEDDEGGKRDDTGGKPAFFQSPIAAASDNSASLSLDASTAGNTNDDDDNEKDAEIARLTTENETLREGNKMLVARCTESAAERKALEKKLAEEIESGKRERDQARAAYDQLIAKLAPLKETCKHLGINV